MSDNLNIIPKKSSGFYIDSTLKFPEHAIRCSCVENDACKHFNVLLLQSAIVFNEVDVTLL